ncbi:MAG: DUF333 domain-containing protein [Candidatus Altiarchaeota archaeon]|nr:DUF333 domain-containing protein [Candidatus Altiarchaeota archaeon]
MEKSDLIVLAVLGIVLVSGCIRQVPDALEKSCIDSGGEITRRMCCKSVNDFPNLCLVGACGCSPDNSHVVKICDCGEDECFDGNSCVPVVNSFEDCVNAGYPVMESYPRQCKTPDGRTFTEEVCMTATGESMSLSEAKQIAVESECGDRLKDTAFCNSNTGTWWIDLDIEQQGCNPACIVDIEAKTAEINWRCTGLLPPEGEDAEIGIANPASVYCEKQGGELRMVETPEGQAGYCVLPDGRVCEEWRFYSSNGSECVPPGEEEYEVAEFTRNPCNQDSDCVTPGRYLMLSHCPYTSKCIDGRCTVICPSPYRILKEFCGTSTYGSCKDESDCVTGGCSGQVCQSKNEDPIITTCEYRDCYNSEDYSLSCRCVDKKCQWAA